MVDGSKPERSMMATSHQRPPRGSVADGRALHRATVLKRSLSVQLRRLSLLFCDLILAFMDCSRSGRRCDSRTRCPVSQVSCSLPSAQRFHPPPVRAAPVDGREGDWCAAFVLLRCPAFVIASEPLRTHGVAGTALYHRVLSRSYRCDTLNLCDTRSMCTLWSLVWSSTRKHCPEAMS